jgi:hypothetical protein
VRVVALPAMLIDAMKRHLAEFPAEDEGLIFRGPLGAPLRRNNFHRSVRWSQSVVQAGLPAGFHPTIYAILATTWQRQAVPAPAS